MLMSYYDHEFTTMQLHITVTTCSPVPTRSPHAHHLPLLFQTRDTGYWTVSSVVVVHLQDW